jgi:uncharacterized membrane protein
VRRLTTVLAGGVALAYPALVYLGLTRWSPRRVGLGIVGLIAVSTLLRRWSGRRRVTAASLTVPACVIALAAVSAALNDATFVLFTPALISASLLVAFGVTLRPGSTPLVERFARMQHELTPDEIRWCRQVTIVWCGFFLVNGLAAIALAFAPMAWWTIYTGGVAYALIGILVAGEFVLRKRRFRRFGTGLLDRALSRLFLLERRP